MVPLKIMYRKNEDRISLLPDCLLLEIISRLELSTKQVIKTTTTISKRWQHLWTRLPTLVFTEEDLDKKNYYNDAVTNFLSFIDQTLDQCPTDVNLQKLKLQIYSLPTLQVNRWIRYAITRKVEEIDLRITAFRYAFCDDELLLNNSCLISLKLSRCRFNPPNGAIRWDKLKCLCLEQWTLLDKDLIGKILSGSPCLETLELNDCTYFDGGIPMCLFRNFGVLESLSCDLETFETLISYGDELLAHRSKTPISMKLSRSVCSPPNGSIRWEKLKFLCIDDDELDKHSIGKILARVPCLETLQLNDYAFTWIDVTSKSVKNLVLFFGGYSKEDCYTHTIKINAPYILSLTIKGDLDLKNLLLENVSSLVNAELNYSVHYEIDEELGQRYYMKQLRRIIRLEKKLLRRLLSRLGHVNKIVLGNKCLQTLSYLEAEGFQFRKGSDLCGIRPNDYRVFSLIQK